MIGHRDICELIPHADSMCLLDRVISWDDNVIVCEADSHLLRDNPLRTDSELPSVSLIEYGAQSMAVHGGLLARRQGRVLGEGYLAVLRDVSFEHIDVSKISGALEIKAEKLMSQGGNMMYQFHIFADGSCVVQGRATVVGVGR